MSNAPSTPEPERIIETKLFVPRPGGQLVPLERLTNRLDAGLSRKLTVVSAPPGFGKTTLLAGWVESLRGRGHRVAWFSLDAGDNDPVLFWTYFATALGRAKEGLGATMLARLQSGQRGDVELLVGSLLNELAGTASGGGAAQVVVVLDDYHAVESDMVHRGVRYFLEHLPPGLHVVIAGRADPALPLGRMRAHGELNELRANDLRLGAGETAEFLNDAMALHLSGEQVATLTARTEGWIAGLQLAAISLQGHEDKTSWVDGFAGDSRYIVDYLLDEVIERQAADVRTFLRDTCILGRMNASLCDAVTLTNDGQEMLEELERSNLFVIPLDDRRGWFRYHRLFADVLRAHLLDRDSQHVRALHRRASDWFANGGYPAEAIEHALAANDAELAANLVEMQGPAMLRARREATLLAWLSRLPETIVRERPTLTVGHAWTLLLHGRLAEAEERLQDVNLHTPASSNGLHSPSANQEWMESLPASIATARAFIAHARGDLRRSIEFARESLELLPAEDESLRGVTGAILATALRRTGEVRDAERACLDALAAVQRSGDATSECGLADILAQVHVAQGKLSAAANVCEQTLGRIRKLGGPAPRGAVSLHIMLAEVARQRGDYEAARHWLESAADLGPQAALPESAYRLQVAIARICASEGDLEGALELLREAEATRPDVVMPGVPPLEAMRTRLQVAAGRHHEALSWARQSAGDPATQMDPAREYEDITLARILLATYVEDPQTRVGEELGTLLDQLEANAIAAGRNGSLIELLVLRARFQYARQENAAAGETIRRALSQAEVEGHLSVFADEGPGLNELLRLVEPGQASAQVGRLRLLTSPGPLLSHVQVHLPEQLTTREMEILGLVASGLRNQEIADELVISVATVKRHIANVYGKLEVENRTAAVARATELGLI